MFPYLSDLINYLFGFSFSFPLPMFGFMVALAFITGNYFAVLEMKRKEADGLLSSEIIKVIKGAKASTQDLIINGVYGFVLGYKIGGIVLNYNEVIKDLPGFVMSLQGSFIGGVVIAALLVYLKYRESEKERLPEPIEVEEVMHPYQHIATITFIAAIGGIFGAKLFDAFEDLERLAADPIGVIFSGSGLSIYGGLLIGGGAATYYAYKKGLKVVHVLDASVPGLMLAYGVGRIGCQLAGDGDWGVVNNTSKPQFLSFLPDWMWSFKYPGNVNRDGVPIPDCIGDYCYELPEAVWPTPFYETLMAFAIFGILWSLRKKLTAPGMIFSLYLTFNGIERFFIEKIRINADYNIFGLKATQAEIIAVMMFIAGVIGIWYSHKLNKSKSI